MAWSRCAVTEVDPHYRCGLTKGHKGPHFFYPEDDDTSVLLSRLADAEVQRKAVLKIADEMRASSASFVRIWADDLYHAVHRTAAAHG